MCKKLSKIVTCFLTLLFVMMQQGAVSAQPSFQVYDTRQQKIVSLQDVVLSMKDNHVLLFGEEHDDSTGHIVQDSLYRMLIGRYGDCTLALEMFERDCQAVLNEYVQGFISRAVLVQDARAWNNYHQYDPLVVTARENKQQVLATNAPRRYVSLVNRRGLSALDSLGKTAKRFFAPLPIDTTDTQYKEKFEKMMGGHAHGGGHRADSRNLLYAQMLWDATMAHTIAERMERRRIRKTKLLHINGRFHSDDKLGIYSQLQKMNPRIRALTISCFPVEKGRESLDWPGYSGLADYIIVTKR